jgi:hypothetical protein
MKTYEICALDANGRIMTAPHYIPCKDDLAAVSKARKLVNDQTVEVWKQSHMVAHIDRIALGCVR